MKRKPEAATTPEVAPSLVDVMKQAETLGVAQQKALAEAIQERLRNAAPAQSQDSLKVRKLEVVDGKGCTRIRLRTSDSLDGAPCVELLNSNGEAQVTLEGGSPYSPGLGYAINLYHGDQPRLRVGLSSEGAVWVRVNNADGGTIWETPSEEALAAVYQERVLHDSMAVWEQRNFALDFFEHLGEFLTRQARGMAEEMVDRMAQEGGEQ